MTPNCQRDSVSWASATFMAASMRGESPCRLCHGAPAVPVEFRRCRGAGRRRLGRAGTRTPRSAQHHGTHPAEKPSDRPEAGRGMAAARAPDV
ncbi:hypothetical protein GCM10023205_33790 [Yinghuangia aomiensis]|uniref:Uncharacterized protein n=1 Tax=Yinghuangia aomiensis TaxID=676205 RepID=A0ABP9HBA2_9ACTN